MLFFFFLVLVNYLVWDKWKGINVILYKNNLSHFLIIVTFPVINTVPITADTQQMILE